MKEIELTPKTEEDLETIWDYSFRQFGILQANECINRLDALFNVLAAHGIGTERAEPGEYVYYDRSCNGLACEIREPD